MQYCFLGEQSKSGAIRSTRQRLHDCSSGPAERTGGGPGRAYRPSRCQLQSYAAFVPVHAGSYARGKLLIRLINKRLVKMLSKLVCIFTILL